MPKCPFCRNAGPLLDSLRMDHSTSGGSSETAENEFTTIPTSWSSALVVTTVTPVANWPRARRNARASSVGSPCSMGPAVCCTSVMSVNGFVLSTGRKPCGAGAFRGRERVETPVLGAYL